MPAVQTFALSAALAVFFVFLLQMSLFVALMSLDIRRQKVGPVAGHRGVLSCSWGHLYCRASHELSIPLPTGLSG